MFMSFFLPITLIKKINSMALLLSLEYYKKVFKVDCNSCGNNPRIYKPISLKGLKYISVGDDFKLDYGGIMEAWDTHNGVEFSPRINIGNNVSFGKNCHIGCINEITVESNVLFGSGVMIMDHNHGKSIIEDVSVAPNKRILYSKGPIRICENVWVGENSCILAGVTVGKNSIVGANSVVTHSIPPNCVVCGNPAKVVKIIKEE